MHDPLLTRTWEMVGEPARRLVVERVEIVAELCARTMVALTEALERELGKERGFVVAQEAFAQRFERRKTEAAPSARPGVSSPDEQSPGKPDDRSSLSPPLADRDGGRPRRPSHLQAFAALVDEVCQATQDFSRVEDRPDRVAYRFTRCVWADHFRRLGRPDIGHWFCDGDDRWARSFNPRIGFQRTQVLMDGDESCDHVFYVEER